MLRAADTRQRWLVLGVVLLAVALRTREFLAARSLWYDEVTTAINIAGRTAVELLRPLDLGQAAPPLFLLSARAAVAITGVTEYALRSPAFLAGLLMLPVMVWLGRRLLAPAPALLSLAWIALSPVLLYYSNELKPYSWDALTSATLLLLALRWLDSPDSRPGLVAVTLASLISFWASFPAVFVVAGVWLALLQRALERDHRRQFVRVAACAVLAALSFAASYALAYRPVAHDPHMRRFWEPGFLTAEPALLARRLPEVIGGPISASLFHRDAFVHLPESLRLAVLATALAVCIAGAAALSRSARPKATLLIAPLVAVYAAFLARQYPVTARLMVFTTPILVLLVCHGLWVLTRSSVRWFTVAGLALLGPAAYHAALQLRDPMREREHPRPIIAQLQQDVSSSRDPVYIAAGSAPHWIFYTTRWDRPDSARLQFVLRHGDPPDGSIFVNHPSRGRPVLQEGADLVLRTAGRLEVYGIYSGAEERFAAPAAGRPDAGWAENEARRVREHTPHCVWLLFTFSGTVEERLLSAALEQIGGRLEQQWRGRHARALRYCFAP